jgi:phage terminase small subunit
VSEQNLGEQVVSKAAEIGIKSQLNEVEALDVDIQTNPLDLAQGKLESVSIDAKGMVIQNDLRAERLVLQTDNIALDSLKAAFGNIELEQSTNAEAKVVLLEEDIQRAFNSEYIKNKLKDRQINVNGEQLTVNADNIKFAFPDDHKISLTADLNIAESGAKQQITLSAKPDVNSQENKIVLEDVEYSSENSQDSAMVEALLDSAQEVLDLRNFELEGISLHINRLSITNKKMTITASALISDFPST